MFMVSMKPSTIIVNFMVVESGVRTKGGLISPFNEKVLVLNKKHIFPPSTVPEVGGKLNS